ncbi:GNAT family N-acetyltransferase [Chryseobacterium caseinilyticum]|uniref:GNAT family N-acetyltransferase n=1 Tax=Chryseobacterium caseinilyticum TaxID=2771428 RepID=A0ABR8Z9F8_9FLAO|nr:GNAT family protein [Chryseobacterium caseinilyticum]MBD8081938.1 GNAT family N-acetyltransferase [Chryseobacterium caseinilyticum]
MENLFQSEFQLETKRFHLKGVTPTMIHQMYLHSEKDAIVGFFGFGESGYERYKSLHENGIETKDHSLFFFVIVDKHTDLAIGNCGFHSWNKEHKKAEIFYNFFNDEDKGKGSMSEILPLVLDFGFKNLDLNRIQGLVADYNIPSIKLLFKNGFVKEGILREDYFDNGKFEDSVCYSLLKSEWKSF